MSWVGHTHLAICTHIYCMIVNAGRANVFKGIQR